MRNAIVIAMIGAMCIASSANATPTDHALRKCVVYDTRTGIAIWVDVRGNGDTRTRGNERIGVARFIDMGDESIWIANQRVTRVPMRVENVVRNWPVRPHVGLRVRCAIPAFVQTAISGVKVCAKAVANGDAYTREMFDQCIADYIEGKWFA